jgi:cytoskeleton protein RodZ
MSGFGATLAAAREAKGLDMADVAARLKLTPRQIEALEAEDWSRLPSAVFVRGFVRNYARILDLDPESLVPPVNVTASATKTITAPSAGVRLGQSPVSRWALIVISGMALFLLVVALLYNWLRRGEDTLLAAAPPMPQQASSSPASAKTNPTRPVGEAHPGMAPQTLAEPLALQPQVMKPASSGTAAPTPPSAAAVAPPGGVKPAPAEPIQNTKPPDRNISLSFEPTSVDAWIQVVDGKGHRFSKLVRAGHPETLSGDPPFTLVVGNAAYVKVTYNGQIIDLKPYIGEKVARLTLE